MEIERSCTYCSVYSEIEREHVIPAAFFGKRTYDSSKQWIVPSCHECNSLASNSVYFSIPEKAKFIGERYKKRYRKLLRIPLWTDEEIKQMSYKFRVSIEQSQIAKSVLLRKLQHLETVSTYPLDFLRPKWVEIESKIWREIQKEREKWEKKFRKETYGRKKL